MANKQEWLGHIEEVKLYLKELKKYVKTLPEVETAGLDDGPGTLPPPPPPPPPGTK